MGHANATRDPITVSQLMLCQDSPTENGHTPEPSSPILAKILNGHGRNVKRSLQIVNPFEMQSRWEK